MHQPLLPLVLTPALFLKLIQLRKSPLLVCQLRKSPVLQGLFLDTRMLMLHMTMIMTYLFGNRTRVLPKSQYPVLSVVVLVLPPWLQNRTDRLGQSIASILGVMMSMFNLHPSQGYIHVLYVCIPTCTCTRVPYGGGESIMGNTVCGVYCPYGGLGYMLQSRLKFRPQKAGS